MKVVKNVEVVQCDFCSNETRARPCEICNKDVCDNHYITFSCPYCQSLEHIENRYTEEDYFYLLVCTDCAPKIEMTWKDLHVTINNVKREWITNTRKILEAKNV